MGVVVLNGVVVTGADRAGRELLYRDVVEGFTHALERLAGGYEANPDTCRDLLQDVHAAIWKSLALYDARCSLRTWVYRVAHNVAISHLLRHRRARFVELTELEAATDVEAEVDRQLVRRRLLELIHALPPLDRQVMLLYLEGVDGAELSEITGLSGSAVGTRIHRLKALLARRFHQGALHE